jgi:hypothetical protein
VLIFAIRTENVLAPFSEQQEAAVSAETVFRPGTVGKGEIKIHISK